MVRFTTAVVAAALAVSTPSSITTTDAFTFQPPVSAKVGSSSFVARPTTDTRTFRSAQNSGMAAAASSSSAGGTMTMLVETSGGLEELADFTERTTANVKNPLAKQVSKAPPSVLKVASLAAVPLSAALGFGLVPSRRLYAHGVGAVLTGLAGVVGKSRLDALQADHALPALAQTLVDNFDAANPLATQAAVRQVQTDYGLLEDEEEFAELCTTVYATYLQGMVKYNPLAKTAELKELTSLQTALGLDKIHVGEAHYQAASEWYRQTLLYTPEEELDDPDHPDRQAMNKLLFLSERALADETPQAFTFEMTRIAKAVGLDYATALDRVADVVQPFYERALASTRAKLGTGAVSAGMLERARTTLGVSAETARDLHVGAYNAHVRQWLGLPDRMAAADEDDEDTEADDDTPPINMDAMKFGEGAMDEVCATF